MSDYKLTSHASFIFIDLPGPPRNLRAVADKDGQVLLEWSTPQSDGGSKIINYVVEKSTAASGAPWAEVPLPDSAETERVLKHLKVSDGIYGPPVDLKIPEFCELKNAKKRRHLGRIYKGECFLRVSAVNEAGRGSASNIAEVTVKKVAAEPSAPGQPTVEVVSDGCVQLRWALPLDEGQGGPIKGYEIQVCEVGSTKWRPLTDKLCPFNEIRLDGLGTDKDLMFRVVAVNQAGRSAPSESSRPIRLEIDVKFIRHLEPITITELPADAVFECELSRPGMNLIWSKDGRDLSLSTRCVYDVTGVGDKAFCVHRLTLVKLGPSEQGHYAARLPTGVKSEADLVIECPPRIMYDASKDIELIAGKSSVIEVPYSGAPVPDVNWSFNSGPLPVGPVKESPMASVDTVYGLTCLRLRQVNREASGSYKLVVSNELGKATLELKVSVLDRPGPVRRLRCAVDDTQPSAAIVAWEEPKDAGGSPITGYIVEKREANKRSWTSLGPAEPGLNRVATGLTPNTAYFFRVMAQNASGCSEPTETETPLVIPSKTKPPSAPGSPEVNDVGTNSCRVSWQPPSSDGGARLAFYHLEKRANQKGNWVRATDGKLSIPESQVAAPYSINVMGLVPDNVYEFRVAAENADSLVSDFSTPSHRISTQAPFSLPGKPSRPELKNVTEKSATLNWKAPYDDGGDTIKRYIVQYKVVELDM
ncbi:fibronectin type III domain protein [Opisthorchis viverrini]|uniref:Fibronectin type III domain protein n=1 Tax=Opisthorchis viverrini TaxID=6198 RepID=A0A1S8X9Z8_OPIVI|nr:fibronectin type III domain protein [Opisthorchis viverrini]